MKDILQQTKSNLIEIKDKMCYTDSDGTKCYKCKFAQFNSDYDDDESKWFCSLQAVINALNYHLSSPENKK